MANGSFAGDLFFDYEHGHIKVLGGEKRAKPRNPEEETKIGLNWTRCLHACT